MGTITRNARSGAGEWIIDNTAKRSATQTQPISIQRPRLNSPLIALVLRRPDPGLNRAHAMTMKGMRKASEVSPTANRDGSQSSAAVQTASKGNNGAG